jgi:ABC-type Fe3+/spermidine/putrescine transport system ATPase subunit
VNFTVNTPTKLVVLGANGSGKTTVLRLLGGHFKPDHGHITLGTLDLTTLSAHERPTSTVFQDYALFPHYTARKNIEFPLRQRRGLCKQEAKNIADQWIDKLHLEKSADVLASELNPGHRQRVAIARSLAMAPKLLLLDEPSGALDPSMKHEIITVLNKAYTERWVDSLVIVTHDLDFTFSVADSVVLLEKGRCIVSGNLAQLYEHPTTPELAHYLQWHNILTCTLTTNGTLQFDGGSVSVPSSWQPDLVRGDTTLTLLLPTNAVRVVDLPSDRVPTITCTVESYLYHGPYCEVLTTLGATAIPTTIRSFIDNTDALPKIGSQVHLALDLAESIAIPKLG